MGESNIWGGNVCSLHPCSQECRGEEDSGVSSPPPPNLHHPPVAVNFLSLAAGSRERAWLNKCLRDDIHVLAVAIAPSEGQSFLTLSVCILLFAQLLSTLLIELFRITKRIRKAWVFQASTLCWVQRWKKSNARNTEFLDHIVYKQLYTF